jgi:hypothetical protein
MRDTMLFDRQKFVLAVHQALKEHDKDRDKAGDSGHNIAIDCDRELEHFADRILELMD